MPGRIEFDPFDVPTAAQLNEYLVDQSLMRFASAAARTTAIPAPTEGMQSWLDDVNRYDIYSGSSWVQQNPTAPPDSNYVLALVTW